jgi:hypothetical protein
MNEQQLAAVKQALEALTVLLDEWTPARQAQLKGMEAVTALQSIISQDALHKMAEESRTSGLRLDDWDKIGCVNHDCDQCKAVQEPVAKKTGIGLVTANGWDSLPVGTLFYTAPQPVPVKTYHDGKPWPVVPKPWVGLTDEEVAEGLRKPFWEDAARALEAILKEKNT